MGVSVRLLVAPFLIPCRVALVSAGQRQARMWVQFPLPTKPRAIHELAVYRIRAARSLDQWEITRCDPGDCGSNPRRPIAVAYAFGRLSNIARRRKCRPVITKQHVVPSIRG